MSTIHKLTRTYVGLNGVSRTFTESVSANGESVFSDLVPHSTTNQHAVKAYTKANLKSLCLFSDQAVTLKTNSSSTPQDTITLQAGKPVLWSLSQDGSGACPFSNDVTDLYWTNASGSLDANVEIQSVHSN